MRGSTKDLVIQAKGVCGESGKGCMKRGRKVGMERERETCRCDERNAGGSMALDRNLNWFLSVSFFLKQRSATKVPSGQWASLLEYR